LNTRPSAPGVAAIPVPAATLNVPFPAVPFPL